MVYEVRRVNLLAKGTSDEDDRDAARWLVDEMKSAIGRGSGNPQGSMGTRYRELYVALRATAERMGVDFRLDHDSLGSLVKANPGLRRMSPILAASIIDGPFERLLDHLDDPAALRLLAPVEPSGNGWVEVDKEIAQLRAGAAAAATGHDRGAIARLCREVFVSLARAAYDEQRHGKLPEREGGKGGATVKLRIEQVIKTEAAGKNLRDLRVLMTKTLDFANSLQHHKDPEDVEVMICADATIMVVSGVRRLTSQGNTRLQAESASVSPAPPGCHADY